MGARTDTAAHDVTAQRQRICTMLDDLDRRVERDVEGAKHAAAHRAESMKDGLASTVEHTVGSIPGSGTLEGQMTEHPLTGTLAAFGAGVALGVVSEGLGGEREPRRSRDGARNHSRNNRDSEARSDGGLLDGLAGILTGSAVSMLTGPIRDQLESLVGEAVRGFVSGDGSRRDGRRTT